jgi:hypothetical protein
MDDAVLWRPPEDVFTSTEIGRLGFDDYEALQRWSVTDLEASSTFVEISEGRGR